MSVNQLVVCTNERTEIEGEQVNTHVKLCAESEWHQSVNDFVALAYTYTHEEMYF